MFRDRINPNLSKLDIDYLYHFGLDSGMDLTSMFHDVRYVCMGGSPVRAEDFAGKTAKELIYKQIHGLTEQENIALANRAASDFANKAGDFLNHEVRPIGKTERCLLYKVGPVISLSHGMGMPSMSIFLHEITKLLYYAGVQYMEYMRLGTSGGLGVEPGTVIVAYEALDGRLRAIYEQIVLGKVRRYPTKMDSQLAERVVAERGNVLAKIGKTMGTDGFYEAQGRLDGALDPGYTEEEKMAFLRLAHEVGVDNIEMEATAFDAFCLRANIPGVVMCATLLDRLKGDQVTSTPDELAQFSDNTHRLALQYINSDIQRRAA